MLIGSATRTNGVLRLMKALRRGARYCRHGQAPCRQAAGDAVACVLKTVHSAHGGKMSIARVLAGQVGDGTTLITPETDAGRVAGMFKLLGHNTEKRARDRGRNRGARKA